MQAGNSFKALSIVHTTLVTGLLIFMAISVFLPLDDFKKADDGSFEMVFQGVAAVASVVCLVTGFSIFRRRLPAIRNSTDPAELKMQSYRGACVLWWAMLEGPGILSVIGYLKTDNYSFLALAIFQLILLAFFAPRKQNIILLLNLTSEEVQRLEGKS